MARLPDSIDGYGAPQGARLSGQAANPLGQVGQALGDVAQDVAAYGKAKDAADDRVASQILRDEQAKFEPTFGEAQARYDGREAGFAAQSTAAFDAHFKPVLERGDLSEGVRWALRQQVDGYKSQFGARAIGVETEKRAGVVAEQQRVVLEAKVGKSVIGYNADFSPKYQELVDGFDGSDAGFADKVLALHDESAKVALEAAPEDVRAKLESSLNARRVTLQAQAMELQDKAHGAFVADNFKTSIAALANTVLTNPASYETSAAEVDTAAAGLPKALRAKAVREAQGDLAAAMVEGLIFRDDTAKAREALEGGQFDGVLDPGKKETLLARVEAAETAGPKSLEEWRQAYEADDALKQELRARASGSTTGFSLQSIVGVFSPREIAQAEQQLAAADRAFAATGNLQTASNETLRQQAIAPPPADGAPPAEREAWDLRRKAAADELAARQKDPAAWAQRSERAGDTGAALQGYWQAATEAADPKARAAALTRYVSLNLGLQERAGIDPSSMRVLTKDMASQLVRTFGGAAPDKKAAALAGIAALWQSLPAVTQLKDGRRVSNRALMGRELKAAGLGPGDVAALVDLSDDPGRLALYADATANPAALKTLPGKGAETAMVSAVDAALAPFLATAGALPGSAEQNDGRRARVRIVARHLVTTQGLSPKDAAEKAASDLVEPYKFVDGYRVPKTAGDVGTIKRGAMQALHGFGVFKEDLTPAPGQGLTREQAQEKALDIVQAHGRWVTTEDDSGLALMVPDARGWTPMADRYGRPIRASWGDLAKMGKWTIHDGEIPAPWRRPPAGAAAAVRAAPAKVAAAFSGAIEDRETGHLKGAARVAAVSPAGALGVRQLMPDTAKAAARRLGIAFDEARLTSDPAYNRKLSDNEISHLSAKYGGNVALVAAAYNAGSGNVDKWIRRYGDPRRGRITADEWVAMIPVSETRDYVKWVLPAAMKRLQG